MVITFQHIVSCTPQVWSVNASNSFRMSDFVLTALSGVVQLRLVTSEPLGKQLELLKCIIAEVGTETDKTATVAHLRHTRYTTRPNKFCCVDFSFHRLF